jgi:hypothetical protein
VQLVEQELLTLPEHLSSSPVFSGVRVTRSLVLCVCFVDRCLSFCTFSFGHDVFFFDIQFLITPLVSSNSSYKHIIVDIVLSDILCFVFDEKSVLVIQVNDSIYLPYMNYVYTFNCS